MQEKLFFKGVWFLPERQSNQLSGDLAFSPVNGIELKLLGILSDDKEETHDPEIILGITEDGKKITLYKGSRVSRSFNSNSFETSAYEAIFMFIGKHFMSVDEMLFSQINCNWVDFDIWLGIYGFKKVEHKKESKESSIEFKQPGDLFFDISGEINCAFQFSTYHPSVKRVSKLTIEQKCEVSLSPKSGTKSFEILFGWFESFHRFMTLAYFEEPPINKLTLRKTQISGNNESDISSVEVLFQTNISVSKYKQRSSDYSFLFTYGQIAINFEQIIQEWYKIESLLSPAIAGLTEALMNRSQATEFKFLNLAHAIETLHRRTLKNEAEDAETFKQKIKTILSSVMSEHSEWLKKKLEFSNERPLQERLVELANEVPEIVRNLLFKPSLDEFIRKVKHSRNYYTHYSKSLEKKAIKGRDLFMLTERLKIFLICLVLKEIGFTDEEIEKTIIRKGVFLFNHLIKYDEAKAHFNDWQ